MLTGVPIRSVALFDECESGLRIRRDREVVRDGGPQACRVDPRPRERVVEHADDPGRSFVARSLQAEPLDEIFVDRGAGDVHRP